MSKEIKATITKEEIKQALEIIINLRSRVYLAKTLLALRDEIHSETQDREKNELEMESPECYLAKFVLEDLDEVFEVLGIKLPSGDAVPIIDRALDDLNDGEKEQLMSGLDLSRELRKLGISMADYLWDGKKYPN